MLVARGRLELTLDVADCVAKSEPLPSLAFVPLTNAIALRSVRLPGEFHEDPADRIIVATAMTMGAQVVSKDTKIRAYSHVEAVWKAAPARRAPAGQVMEAALVAFAVSAGLFRLVLSPRGAWFLDHPNHRSSMPRRCRAPGAWASCPRLRRDAACRWQCASDRPCARPDAAVGARRLERPACGRAAARRTCAAAPRFVVASVAGDLLDGCEPRSRWRSAG